VRINLDELFPPAPPHAPREIKKVNRHGSEAILRGEGAGLTARKDVSTRWAAIYTLELRGLDQKDIATALGLAPQTVSSIVRDPRYIAYREKHLAELDSEFVQMKPLAFAALKNGLMDNDRNTALRASEQWFKGAGFGGFAKDPVPQTRLTAEDVAAQLLAGLNVNVQVNVGGAAEGGEATRTTAASSVAPVIDAE
jgi:transcriptional regulator with XRE-family HTH domain